MRLREYECKAIKMIQALDIKFVVYSSIVRLVVVKKSIVNRLILAIFHEF
jgi:hypothetical protein